MSKSTIIGQGLGGSLPRLLEFGTGWEVSYEYQNEFEFFKFNSLGEYWYVKNDNLGHLSKPEWTSGQSGYWVKK